MIKKIVLGLSLVSTVVLADPAPFGLQMGKATSADVKSKYNAKFSGINKYSGGEMYSLNVSKMSFDGLQSATAVFGKNGKLQGVLCTLSKDRFKDVFVSMKSKYKLVKSNIPFVGDTSAEFVDGNTVIDLDAPHLSFEMSMNYVEKGLLAKFTNQVANEAQQKKKREDSQL